MKTLQECIVPTGCAQPTGALFSSFQTVLGGSVDLTNFLDLLEVTSQQRGVTCLGGQLFGRVKFPASLPFGYHVLAGRHVSDGTLSGVRMFTVSSPHDVEVKVTVVYLHGSPVGWRIEDADAIFGWFPGLKPACDGSQATQAENWFKMLEALLAAGGFEFRHVVRTWFYLDDILNWYDTFNRVRNAYFAAQGIDHFIPASTGVGAANTQGSALIGDVLCILPKNSNRVSFESVASPLQGSALDYRSSFSRAAEIAGPLGRWLLVSGTASIGLDGRTLYSNDANAQVAHTMEVLSALLDSRGMSWEKVWRGVAYFRDPDIIQAFEGWCLSTGRMNLPFVFAVCEICRNELLFEVELDAFSHCATFTISDKT